MKKIFIQAILSISLFFGIWSGLTHIDFVSIFNIQEISDKSEEKLGDLFFNTFQLNEKENNDPFVVSSVDSIVSKICLANKIERKSIKIHIIEKDEINAFALPNGHLIIYSGLILNSDNQEQLSGVICHEIAHIVLKHVFKKLIKEVGISAIVSMTTGNTGSEAIKSTIETLSSTAFDRSLEKDADIKAADYLLNSKIDPKEFSNFLYKLSAKENEVEKYLSWMSTHPDSKERAIYILEYKKGKKVITEKVLTEKTWKKLVEKLNGVE